MTKRGIKCKIVDKRIGGFFSNSYYITVQILETKSIIKPVVEREVPSEQYYHVNKGEVITLTMYSLNGKKWFFKADEVDAE